MVYISIPSILLTLSILATPALLYIMVTSLLSRDWDRFKLAYIGLAALTVILLIFGASASYDVVYRELHWINHTITTIVGSNSTITTVVPISVIIDRERVIVPLEEHEYVLLRIAITITLLGLLVATALYVIYALLRLRIPF